MDQERRKDIALMRYSVIAPLITGLSDDYDSLEAFFRSASAKGVIHPDGTLKHYAPETIEKWYRNYKQHGFDALVPKGRADHGIPRKLDDELQEQIRYLRSNYPRMSAAAIYRQLQDNGCIKNGQVLQSTVNRYINMITLQMKTTTNQDMRRYERPHINEVWCIIFYIYTMNSMIKQLSPMPTVRSSVLSKSHFILTKPDLHSLLKQLGMCTKPI